MVVLAGEVAGKKSIGRSEEESANGGAPVLGSGDLRRRKAGGVFLLASWYLGINCGAASVPHR